MPRDMGHMLLTVNILSGPKRVASFPATSVGNGQTYTARLTYVYDLIRIQINDQDGDVTSPLGIVKFGNRFLNDAAVG